MDPKNVALATNFPQTKIPENQTILTKKEIAQLNKFNIISKSEAENFWKIEPTDNEKIRFPKSEIERIVQEDNPEDYAIIYLTGISINRQKSSKKIEFSDSLRSGDGFKDDNGMSGYFLIKIKNCEIQDLVPGYDNGILPDYWKRLTTRDAIEAIILMKFILDKKPYRRRWHSCIGYKSSGHYGYNIRYINLIKLSKKFDNKITIMSKPDEDINLDVFKLSAITVLTKNFVK